MASIRHRRSKSCGTEGWLQHKQVNPIPLGTVLQPYYKTTKCVDKLTDIKDVNNRRTSKYCLITQENDTDGELETKLYKVSSKFY
jgi:kinesin family protein 23